uniref:F-box domain-containing protein n=1 Tax=Mycena chlorophos TaxID=658473 RepID=A0ABQ0M9Q9_MYCCL|nr:predicted protein [Mycena chlorophos]
MSGVCGINQLPFELLSQILVMATRGPITLSEISFSRCYEPLPSHVNQLHSVCSYWRDVALQTPELWHRQILPISGFGIHLSGCLAEKSGMYLERSAPLPFKVVISPFNNDEEVILSPALLAARDRWSSLVVEPYRRLRQSDIQVLSELPIDGFRKLGKVVIDITKELDRDGRVGVLVRWPEDGITLDFRDAPQLRDFILRVPWEAPIAFPEAPWAQLVEVTVSHPSAQSCLEAVVACIKATSISIDTSQWAESAHPGPTETSVLLPLLDTLELRIDIWSTGEHLAPFLRRIRAPKLKRLTLRHRIDLNREGWTARPAIQTLETFLQHAPEVEQLVLSCPIDVHELPFVLIKTPNITTLQFSNPPTTVEDDGFFEDMQSLAAQMIAPKLTEIEMFNIGDMFSERAFEGFVRSRWWLAPSWVSPEVGGISRLKKVIIRNPWQPDFDLAEFARLLCLLRAEGLVTSYHTQRSGHWEYI